MVRILDAAHELEIDTRLLLHTVQANGATSCRSASQLVSREIAAAIRVSYPEWRTDPLHWNRATFWHDTTAYNMPETMTTAAAARFAMQQPATVRQWASRGKLAPAARTDRGAPLYRPADVADVARRAYFAGLAKQRRTPDTRTLHRLTPDDDAALITTAEAAKLAGVAPATIRAWSHRGKLDPADPAGTRPRLYRIGDVRAVIGYTSMGARTYDDDDD